MQNKAAVLPAQSDARVRVQFLRLLYAGTGTNNLDQMDLVKTHLSLREQQPDGSVVQ